MEAWRYQKGNQKPYIEGQTIQRPKEKEQTIIYKTIHKTQKIEQHEPHEKPGVYLFFNPLNPRVHFCEPN